MIRVGIGGWVFEPWRGTFYPKGLPHVRELAHASRNVTSIEINSTFYASQKPASFRRWASETPDDFVFSLKGPRYTTHRRVLAEAGSSVERFFGSGVLELKGKLGPVLWQLPARFTRDEDRLADALAVLPPGRHCFEFRHESWFTSDVLELLRAYGVALAYGDHPDRPFVPLELTADWTFLRFHFGHRGRRGNYSETELQEWAARVRDLRARVEVFAYFNNDWEGFAPRNAERLRALL